MAETPTIEVTQYSRGRRVWWRITLPETPELSGRIDVNSRAAAIHLVDLLVKQFGWQVHECTPDDALSGGGFPPATTTEETNR